MHGQQNTKKYNMKPKFLSPINLDDLWRYWCSVIT